MPLLTHVAWGAAFAAVGGTSFFTLRIASLAALALGCVALFFVSRRRGATRGSAAFLALALAFSPTTWAFANSFMTDVSGMALTLAGALAGARCMAPPGAPAPMGRWLALGVVTSAAYLCRQPAALPGIALAVVCLRRRPRGALTGVLLPLAATVAAHHVWLHHIHGAPHSTTLARIDFGLALRPREFAARIAEVVLGLSFLAAPALLAAGFLPARGQGRLWAAGLGLGFVLATIAPEGPFGDVLCPAGLRIDRLAFHYVALEPAGFATAIQPAALALTLWAFAAAFAHGWSARGRLRAFLRDPWRASLVLAAAAHLVLLTLGTVLFQRYYLPVLALGLPVWAAMPRRPPVAAWLAAGALAVFALAATRDYFDRQRAWWQAAELLLAQGVAPTDVNASFEFCGVHRFAPNYRDRSKPRSGPFLMTQPERVRPLLYAQFWPDTIATPDRRHAIAFGIPPGYDVLAAVPYRGWLAKPGHAYALRKRSFPPPAVPANADAAGRSAK